MLGRAMGIHERLARSFDRARTLVAETAKLMACSRETIADARNRVHAIRLMRELRAMTGSAPARAVLVRRPPR